MVKEEHRDISTNISKHKIMAWLSPNYPIGAFAYSHGLEQEIASGKIMSASAAEAWIADLVKYGAGWNDAVLLCQAYKCSKASLGKLSELASALSQTKELYDETIFLGKAFAKMTSNLTSQHFSEMPLPLVVGFAAKKERIELESILPLYIHSFVANLITVAVRLVPIGQSEGQRILFDLFPLIETIAQKALKSNLDDLNNACILADIASMKHETLKTRIFRS